MAVWQTNEKGALPPPTDLECGVYIDLEEKNKRCLAKRPHFRGVMGEERQIKSLSFILRFCCCSLTI